EAGVKCAAPSGPGPVRLGNDSAGGQFLLRATGSNAIALLDNELIPRCVAAVKVERRFGAKVRDRFHQLIESNAVFTRKLTNSTFLTGFVAGDRDVTDSRQVVGKVLRNHHQIAHGLAIGDRHLQLVWRRPELAHLVRETTGRITNGEFKLAVLQR